MSWEQLDLEIAEMFDGYSTRADDLQRSLDEWSAWRESRDDRKSDPLKRKKAVLAAAAWRKANPERSRASQRLVSKRRRERAKADPEFAAKFKLIRSRSDQRYREKTKEQRREYFRAHKRKQREERRAAAGLGAPEPRHCGRCGDPSHNRIYCKRVNPSLGMKEAA